MDIAFGYKRDRARLRKIIVFFAVAMICIHSTQKTWMEKNTTILKQTSSKILQKLRKFIVCVSFAFENVGKKLLQPFGVF